MFGVSGSRSKIYSICVLINLVNNKEYRKALIDIPVLVEATSKGSSSSSSTTIFWDNINVSP